MIAVVAIGYLTPNWVVSHEGVAKAVANVALRGGSQEALGDGSMSTATYDYQVYWVPGCTSCLRTKEFLSSQGIAFESINVAEQPEALEDLARIGFRSVPVVRRGDDAVFCQELQDVADFVGVLLKPTDLTIDQLVEKLDWILQAAQRFMKQLSDEQLGRHFPGRDRPYRDLAYHIFAVAEGFLEAAQGGSLEMEAFLRTPPDGMVSGAAIADAGEVVRGSVQSWWHANRDALPDRVKTYYGERTTASVLERTAWHAAQHCRQLQAVVEMNNIAPEHPLGERELGGLPLPETIYDDEISMNDFDVEAKAKSKTV